MAEKKDELKKHIKTNYGTIAKQGAQGCGPCCGGNPTQSLSSNQLNKISIRLGYSSQDLMNSPQQANMGLGCGNPLAIASIKMGETVLDLGSGGGFDCFLARKQVGESGHVIGVDMTPEMIDLAKKNAHKIGYTNVEFRLGEIENLPVEDECIDVIISNCVINLSLEKEKVFNEAYRVLKVGGRLAISDILATASLPDHIKHDLTMLSGCVAGAETMDTIEELLSKAGFSNITLTPKDNSKEILKSWVPNRKIEDYVASFNIEAVKK
jgi:arsenite methyltransferase